MDATNTTGSSDDFRGKDHSPNGSSHRLPLGAVQLAALGIAAAVSLAVKNPDIRKVGHSVLHDPEVYETCRGAGEDIWRAVAASWSRHGGPAALAGIFLR